MKKFKTITLTYYYINITFKPNLVKVFSYEINKNCLNLLPQKIKNKILDLYDNIVALNTFITSVFFAFFLLHKSIKGIRRK